METKTVKSRPVPLDEAKAWVKTWQEMNPKCAKAFLIPVSDLVEAFLEMGIAEKVGDNKFHVHTHRGLDVRGYLATDPDPTQRTREKGYGNRMFIVGTRDEDGCYRDIVEDEKLAAAADGRIGSGIFDFTHPCPSDCDPNSPLNNP
ncbi:MAG: hypothetical protein AAF901_03000 [Bacteroidota bacterium]